MKIRSMTATFGKLDRARLEPGPGLNLIYAPNEGGKSTWAAFWKAMLYGIDTRDRDKKGHLADKNRYQPWSGAPMEGELVLEWQGRDITIRRGPKGNTPFGSFSATYTATGEPVPSLTAADCGPLLTGVGREVFERSAFLGAGGSLTVTAAPELERRIAALVSSGEEDVSFSQTQATLKEWRNRRWVNRSVGLIPKVEGALAQARAELEGLEEVTSRIAALEAQRAQLEGELTALRGEEEVHRRLAQADLNRRCAQAGQELEEAQSQLTALEGELSRFGPIPPKDRLKEAQGELQYLNLLDEEIKKAEEALSQAQTGQQEAQGALEDPRFEGLSGEEAQGKVHADLHDHSAALRQSGEAGKKVPIALVLGSIFLAAGGALDLILNNHMWLLLWAGTGLSLVFALVNRGKKSKLKAQAAQILERWSVQTPEELEQHLADYQSRCRRREEADRQVQAIRETLADRTVRRDNTKTQLMDFVHTFAPTVTGLFGCSAALSRALGVDHELAIARDRVAQRRRRREDLLAQGGQDFQTLELLYPPDRSPEETRRAMAAAAARLDQVKEELNQARGRQKTLGDPAALAAQVEGLEGELDRRQKELQALDLAMKSLEEANSRLQERFSPQLNRLAGAYLARLTGGRYQSLTLNRELEGAAAREEDLLPHSALALSRGTVDQLYLSVRLAVCALCLPEKPPLVLDDSLAAFDQGRMELALELLNELAGEQQVLLFSCHRREQEAMRDVPGVSLLEL